MERILCGIVIYLIMGFMLVIYDSMDKRQRFYPLRALVGWLPGLLSRKTAKWIVKN